MSRYTQLIDIIDEIKPRMIVETGTWHGGRAIEMINQAAKYHDKITYIGYDLFEDATPETDKEEFNIKPHCDMLKVLEKIKKAIPETCQVILRKGNTRNTLKEHEVDFAYIDGGHSVETIKHDFDKLKKSKCIVLDDYYPDCESNKEIDTTKIGCNCIHEEHGGKVLPKFDKALKHGIIIQMLRIDNE